MKFKFVFPPQWNPMNPHFSLYSLAGHAKEHGIDFIPYDFNLQFYQKILTPGYLEYSKALAKNAYEYLYTRLTLGKYRGDKDKKFAYLAMRYFEIEKYLKKTPQIWAEVKHDLPSALAVFHDKNIFYQPDRLLHAYLTIDKALELISLPFYPSRLHFNDFASPSHPMTVEGAVSFSKDSQENPFYMLAKSFVFDLLKDVENEPYVIGISINSHSQLFSGLTISRLIIETAKRRGLKNVHVNLGGNYFLRVKQTLLDKPLFINTFTNSVTIGEGEKTLVKLCQIWENKGDLGEVPNLIYIDKNKKPSFTYYEEPLPLGQRAMPCLDGLPLKEYFTPEIVLSTRTSKGCYWQKCTFCDTDYGITPDVRPTDHVLKEWSLVKDKYGIENFELIDESMTPSYMNEFCQKLIDAKLNVHYFGNGRTDKEFVPSVFELLKNSGLTMTLWGIESGCPRIMKLIKKGVDFDKRLDILRAAHDKGLWNFAFIFFGFPSETEEEAQSTIDLIKNNREIINAYGRSVFTLGKHSKIRASAEELGIVDMISDDQEFSTILTYTVSRGMDRQQALKVADRCRLECAKAYDSPLWMYLRHREVIHLYLKEKGYDFVENYKLSEENLKKLKSLYMPTPEQLLALGYVKADDSP